MKSIVFFCSGNGGNLKYIFLMRDILNINISAVFINQECGASDFAKMKGIPVFKYNFDRTKKDDEIILTSLKKLKPNIVITTINRILSSRIISLKEIKFINLHYSLLPAYGGLIGLKPLEEGLKRVNSFSGTTCHEVEEEVDSGKTLSQGVFIIANKTISSLAQVNFECGLLTLVSGILSLLESNLVVKEKMVWKDVIIYPGLDKEIILAISSKLGSYDSL